MFLPIIDICIIMLFISIVKSWIIFLSMVEPWLLLIVGDQFEYFQDIVD